MVKIKDYSFPLTDLSSTKDKIEHNWPVVYLLDNKQKVYVGETYNLISRMKQHWDNPEKRIFNRVHVIYDSDFNKSATLDIESALIKYMAADEKFTITNKNIGLVDSDYYERLRYQDKINVIWNKLKGIELAQKDLIEIENSDLFKYSPYKALSDDQLEVTRLIKEDLYQRQISNLKGIYFINGLPGSGKTVLATYLLKYLSQDETLSFKKIAIVVAMTSLRNTLKKAIKNVDGLKANMVIGPSELHKDEYDLLIVDEAHRLRQRKGIMHLKTFDEKNLELGLPTNADELDWIKASSKHVILFYDENQSVRPSDINSVKFTDLDSSLKFTLNSQFRIKAGMEFVYYIRNIFNNQQMTYEHFDDYEVGIYSSFKNFTDNIYEKNKSFGMSLIVSGYSFEWISKNDKSKYDICIDNICLQWNTTATAFIYSKNAAKEVGCIHTVQGYELNYVGVIIGKEIDYDFSNNRIIINSKEYHDRNGKVSTDSEQLKKYIINIYVTLATRGIKAVYFYVINENMKKYLSEFFENLD